MKFCKKNKFRTGVKVKGACMDKIMILKLCVLNCTSLAKCYGITD